MRKPFCPLFEAKNIQKAFPGVIALDSINFDIRYGEVHALVGENGAGKSTLIKVISGAYPYDNGILELEGQQIFFKSPYEARQSGIHTIYQEQNLVFNLSIAENIFLGSYIYNKIGLKYIDKRRMNHQADNILNKLQVDIDSSQEASKLNVGQCQMVAIAKALANKVKILILDEPTAPLSDIEIRVLFNLIHKFKEKGISIIYISHRLEEVFQVADRITVLRDGQKIQTFVKNEVNKDKLIRSMVGRALGDIFPKRIPKMGKESLKVKNLSIKSKFQKINFSLHEGEIIGFAGLVGAGRSDLVRAIFGMEKYDVGDIEIKGIKVQQNSPSKSIANGIALLPEDRRKQALMMSQSVKHNISLVTLRNIKRLFFIDTHTEKSIAMHYITKLSIKCLNMLTNVRFLSGGNQQKVVIARWLSTQADIIIFDEPTLGVDIGAKMQLYKIICDLSDEGKSVIIVSSELPELLGLCDKIFVMKNGNIKKCYLSHEATQEKILRCAI